MKKLFVSVILFCFLLVNVNAQAASSFAKSGTSSGEALALNSPSVHVGHFFGVRLCGTSEEWCLSRARVAPWNSMNEVYLSTLTAEKGTGKAIYDGAGQQQTLDKVMKIIHDKNPDCKMYFVMWWGQNQIGEICEHPDAFVASYKKILANHKNNGGISGLVIDWESDGSTTETKFATFIDKYRKAFPGQELRVSEDGMYPGLSAENCKKLDFLMPQSYQQWNPSLSRATQAIEYAGADKVIIGMESEHQPQDPVPLYVDFYKKHGCAGIFAWRLCTDDPQNDFPRFTLAKELWTAMH